MHYVIGDIHGQLPALKLMLQKIEYNRQEDFLYFLGDYVDWGPASIGVIQYICQLQEESAQCATQNTMQSAAGQVFAILGNHDLMMLQSIKHPLSMHKPFCYENNWCYNRGQETYKQYKALSSEEQKKIQHWLEHLPTDLTIEVEGRAYVLAHGIAQSMVPKEGKLFGKDTVEQAVWARGDFVRNLQPEVTLIRGHEITQSLRIEFWDNNIINMDCGAKAIGNLPRDPFKLACLRLEDKEEFYVCREDLAQQACEMPAY